MTLAISVFGTVFLTSRGPSVLCALVLLILTTSIKAESFGGIRQAAQACRDTVPPESTRESPTYRTAMETVLKGGSQAKAQLLRAAQSDALDPFERWLTGVWLERIQSPKPFTTVEPYLEAVLIPERRRSALQLAFPRMDLKPLSVEMLHDDCRTAVKRHSDAYSQLTQLASQIAATAREDEDGSLTPEECVKLDDAFDDGVAAIRKKLKLSTDDIKLLVSSLPQNLYVSLRYCAERRLNLSHRLAWEEAMVRPLPWPLKLRIFHLVQGYGNPKSAIPLAELARQATFLGEGAAEAAYEVIDALLKHSDAESARALVYALALDQKQMHKNLRIYAGKTLVIHAGWQRCLEQIRKDPSRADDVKIMENAIQSYRTAIQKSGNSHE